MARSGVARPDGLLALGLLGDLSAVEPLLGRLADAALAEPAALALELLCGAGLMETVFVPDPVDEDELFEHEREQLQQGVLPTRPDGQPYGEHVTRLSQDRWASTVGLDPDRYNDIVLISNR